MLLEEKEIIEKWVNSTKIICSIACLTYNHQNYISAAIDGFLSQKTNFPFEIIIHDDASTDDTVNILQKYKDKYPKIIKLILQKENQYSQGIKNSPTYIYPICKGQYIAKCEGDDCWTDPYKLQKQVDFLDSNSEYVMCSHDITAVDEKNKHIPEYDLDPYHKTDIEQEDLILANKYAFANTICFRNVIIEYPQEQQQVKNGDTFLYSLLGKFGKCKWLGNEIGNSLYRIHTGGVWSMTENVTKNIGSFTTYYWLYQYYKRIDSEYKLKWYNKLIATVSKWSPDSEFNLTIIIKEHQQMSKELEYMKNGISYRLGKLIISPLKKIKERFT